MSPERESGQTKWIIWRIMTSLAGRELLKSLSITDFTESRVLAATRLFYFVKENLKSINL